MSALAGAVALIVVVVAAAVLVDLGESAGPEQGITLAEAAADPAAFAGTAVTVSGEIAETGYASPADARIAFAIGDDAGRTVLVLPRAGAEVPRGLEDDTVLRVRGIVRDVGAKADERGASSATNRLLAATDARAIVRADRVELLNPRRIVDQSRPPFPRAGVGAILADPAAFDSPVTVRGRARHVGATGFVLSADDASIYVGAPAAALRRLTEGELVGVAADVERLSSFRAAWAAGRTGDAPAGSGDPFLVLRSLRP